MSSAAALLHVRRLPSNALARLRPVEGPLHVLRCSRRRGLAITAFEVDPDALEREEQQAGGGGKPAAALLCAGPGGGAKALDF
jgi:hypothetical protein